MKKFIHEENLKLFRKQLAETTDPKRRQMLLKLIEEEEAKDIALGNSQGIGSVGKSKDAP
jgi:hypothetical protein